MNKKQSLKKKAPVAILLSLLTATPMSLSAQNGADTIQYSNTIKVYKTDSHDVIINKAAHVVPKQIQLDALRNEFIAFIHIGPNTFTRKEWGTGEENPNIFTPNNLNTDQWCEALKNAGMRMVVLTTKHHDGFVLWQTRYTKHGIMSSPYKNGQGDIMRDLAASCKKYGLKLGVYLSPADLYQMKDEGLYGNSSKKTLRTIPRPVEGRPFANKTTFQFEVDDYNEYFLNQLFELLTEYGDISEVWFDGAHPKNKGGQTYDYLAWKKLIRTLAPNAVIFGKEDVRWAGNEAGDTRETEWNVIPYQLNPNEMNRFHDLMGVDLGSRTKLFDANYLHYQQAEVDTSIREGWFYRDDETQNVRSADDVFDIYERTIGGNATLILNIPPNREGLFSAKDVEVLNEVGNRIRKTYSTNLLQNAVKAPKELIDNDDQSYIDYTEPIVIELPNTIKINRIVLQEAILKRSERVEEHAVDAWINNEWKEIARATNIGYKRILRFNEVETNKLRLRVLASRATPAISTISAYFYQERPPMLSISKNKEGLVEITEKQQVFKWHGKKKEHTKSSLEYNIYYTTDGSTPTTKSKLYQKPFAFPTSGTIKAVAIAKNDKGAITTEQLGKTKKHWRITSVSSVIEKFDAQNVIDADKQSYWLSNEGKKQHITITLPSIEKIKGIAYTPPTDNKNGMIEVMDVYAKNKKGQWILIEEIEFGNLINSPTQRFHSFKKPFSSKEIMIEAKRIAGNGTQAAIAEIDLY